MAKPKASKSSSSKSPKAPSKPAKPSPKPAAASTYDPSKDRRALHALVARHGHVSAAHRDAFDHLIDDTARAELGNKTRASGVFREGVAWAVAIDQAFKDYPAIVATHYSKQRFTYFLDRLTALDAVVTAQDTRRGDQTSTRSTAAERETAARSARQALLSKLKGFAGRRREERNALDTATGRTGDTTELGASIQALAKLGRTWLSRGDETSKILAASAGLTEVVIDDALAAAEALTGAATDATLAGRKRSADAPEVNLVEGTVLHEMDEASRCFDDAHEASPVIPRLTAGPATRHVLDPRAGRKAAPGATNGAATPAPPATTGTMP